jgi:hypothetical protein
MGYATGLDLAQFRQRFPGGFRTRLTLRHPSGLHIGVDKSILMHHHWRPGGRRKQSMISYRHRPQQW